MAGWDLTQILIEAAGCVVSFAGGAIGVHSKREARFERRVDVRLQDLESEVAACRKRDGEVLILRMGLQMIVPELQRLDRGNPVLLQVANAFKALPDPDLSMEELMEKLNDVPGTGEYNERTVSEN